MFVYLINNLERRKKMALAFSNSVSKLYFNALSAIHEYFREKKYEPVKFAYHTNRLKGYIIVKKIIIIITM